MGQNCSGQTQQISNFHLPQSQITKLNYSTMFQKNQKNIQNQKTDISKTKIKIFLKQNENQPDIEFAITYSNSQLPELTEQMNKTINKIGIFDYYSKTPNPQSQNQRIFQSSKLLGPYKLKNGTIYIGQWKNGKIHGNGRYYLPDKSLFQGITKENQIQGYGRIIHPNGDYFQGQFKQKMANGQGLYVQKDKIYKGMFKNNLQHGYGKQFSNLFQFQGQYYQGFKKKGKLILKNKPKYIYQGQFKFNKFHGYGILQQENYKYQGNFINGQKYGFGKLIQKKVIYEGWFQNDQKNGKGKLIKKGTNTIIQKGKWVNDIYLG